MLANSIEFLRDLAGFVSKRKKFWLLPLILILILLGAIFVLGSGSVITPFIYAIF